jgi:CRP/FNR family transcriptional regulator, cyclic AMP receptor protein
MRGQTATDLGDARRLLADCALFCKLPPHERNALVARAHMRRFQAGDTIFLMGEPHDSLMAVLTGEVSISMSSADGKEIMLAVVHAGEVFGEIAMLDAKPRSAAAKALTVCSLAILHRRDVLATLERNPAAWLGLVEVLCSRLRRTDEHLLELALLKLPVRLARALLRAVDGGRAQPANRTNLRLSQNELANLVGAARENVNKCLREWKRGGIVRMDKRVLKITDRVALEAVARQ